MLFYKIGGKRSVAVLTCLRWGDGHGQGEGGQQTHLGGCRWGQTRGHTKSRRRHSISHTMGDGRSSTGFGLFFTGVTPWRPQTESGLAWETWGWLEASRAVRTFVSHLSNSKIDAFVAVVFSYFVPSFSSFFLRTGWTSPLKRRKRLKKEERRRRRASLLSLSRSHACAQKQGCQMREGENAPRKKCELYKKCLQSTTSCSYYFLYFGFKKHIFYSVLWKARYL